MSCAPKPSRKRLLKEYAQMNKNPPPHIVAAPLPSNILEWRFCIYGLKECDYEGGYYHGILKFPEGYPFKPPGIMMLTPTGRFECATRLCLSMSDFHPENWNPAWSVESILKGLLSFMLENTQTTGSVITTAAEKRRLAQSSLDFNLKDKIFVELFPEMVQRIKGDRADGSSARMSATVGDNVAPKKDVALEGVISNWFLLFLVVGFAYMVSGIIAQQE